jgi:hypothetical protein
MREPTFDLGSRRRTAMTTTLEQARPPRPDEEEERQPRWELAECTCPDYCERDHEQD